MRHVELNNLVMQLGEDGFYQLEKDKEAAIAFQEEVDAKSLHFKDRLEKIQWMIDNQYYDKQVFDQYTPEEITTLYDLAEASYDGYFKSYMQINKFFNEYALKTRDGKTYLENAAERNVAAALNFAKGNFERAKHILESFMEQRVQPATPTYMNASRARGGEMVSCFLLTMDDTTNSIEYNLSTMAQLSRIGGGVACDLSNLRAFADPIMGQEKKAKGTVGVAKMMEGKFGYYEQPGRKGSGAAYINVFHPDVLRLLDTKKINADEKVRLKTLSLGLIAPQKFYDLAEADEMIYGFSPYDIREHYGLRMTDIDFDDMYDVFMQDDRISKHSLLNGRDFLTRIAVMQFQSGYPYIMNITNANKHHALDRLGRIVLSNLCTEIFQLQEVSIINDYDSLSTIKRDVSCNLASLNITNVMEFKKIKESTHVGIEVLTDVSDSTSISNAPGVRKANAELHSVGLGAMDLHGYLAKNHIAYESFEARDFARTFFMMVNFHSIEKSMEIAKERNAQFKGFKKSRYADGTYFAKYLKNNYAPKTERVAQLFDGMHIPTPDDWAKLAKDVQKYGLYNAYRLAIAPTGSISYVHNATSSVLPIVDLIEKRKQGDSLTYYPAPHLNKTNRWFFKSAYDMDMAKMLDMVAVIQEHVDQGISTTLFVKATTSTAELAKLYIRAAKLGLKALYYTRVKDDRKNLATDTEQVCVSCSV